VKGWRKRKRESEIIHLEHTEVVATREKARRVRGGICGKEEERETESSCISFLSPSSFSCPRPLLPAPFVCEKEKSAPRVEEEEKGQTQKIAESKHTRTRERKKTITTTRRCFAPL